MRARRVLLIFGAALALAGRLPAQNPPAPDTSRAHPPAAKAPVGAADTARAPAESATVLPDTAQPDSLKPDSLRPVLPPFGNRPGPLPVSRRYVFTPNDWRWSGALTLGELLRRVPGVFLARPGWFGQPEVVTYAGQGAGSVEIYWDGFAVAPLGLERHGFDFGLYDMGLFRRIEVEVSPTVLRIYLTSDTPYARRPRTEVSFSTGDAQTNAYRIRYLNRWGSGFGLGAGVTYFGTNGPNTAPGHVGELGLWGKATWMPSDRLGVEYQVASYSLQRDEFSSRVSSGSLPGVDVRRTDSFVHTFAATRPGGMGWRFDALLGTSTFRDTAKTLNASVSQATAALGYRAERWSAELTARLRDGSDPFDLQARVAVSPVRPVTLAATARRVWVLGGGEYLEAGADAEVRPLAALRLYGSARLRRISDTSLVTVDTTQRVADWSGGFTADLGRVFSLDASLGVHNPIAAPVLGAFATQIPQAAQGGATTASVAYEIRPWRFLTLGGWYRHPLDSDSVAFEPPHHSLTRATFHSAFLPHFRRGVFDVMGQLELEAWGSGTVGLDAQGDPIRLQGESIWNLHVQVRLVGAIFYWTMRNIAIKRYQVIPGFEMPRAMQRFGIIWEFTN